MPPVPWDLGLYPIQTDLWCEMLNSAAGDYFLTKANAGTSFFLPSHTLHRTGNRKKLHWKQNKWKKPWCFLPWLDASSWQNKSLDWELKAFSVLIPCHTKGDSWPAACMGGFRRNPGLCALDPELLAAACETGLEQSQVTGYWHGFLVATVKNHLVYMLCHMCAASSLGPVKTLAGGAKSCPLAWLIFGNCSSFQLALE